MSISYYSLSSRTYDNSSKCHCDCLDEKIYSNGAITLTKTNFGFVKNSTSGDIEPVSKYTWHNENLMTVSVMTYGATVLKIEVPNRKMKTDDIVLGFDTLEEYIENKEYKFGATLGRVAGVIQNAEYRLKKCDYEMLSKNFEINGKHHHLDGGFFGMSNVNWIPYVDGLTLILTYFSRHGDEGYPGNLITCVKYQITEDNRFNVTYQASADVKTPVNICQRLYFNLAGHAAGPTELFKHAFHMNCDKLVETRKNGIFPTGKLENVGSTNYDLRVPQLMIFAMIKLKENKTATYFSINKDDPKSTKHFVGQFIHRQSGRAMEVYSNQKFVTFSPCNNFPGATIPTLDTERY